jgi:K+-sensing histidine kinase KdpD
MTTMVKSFSVNSHSDAGNNHLYNKTLRYSWAGILFGLAFPLLATLIKLLQLHLPINLLNISTLHSSEPLMWIIDTAPLFLGLLAGVAGRRQDILLETNRKLVDREKELTDIKIDLERRVKERINELQQRNSQMRSSVYFMRQIAEIKDLTALPIKTVELVKQHFDQYDVNLFLLDETGKMAILQASSSEVGRKKLDLGYRVNVGDQSIVGRVSERAKLYTYQKNTGGVGGDSRENENPKTQSEIAIPLVARGGVIGVLDIQSEQHQAFDQNETEILQLLADQVAASIDNARLLNRSQAFIGQLEILTAKQTQSTWREYLKNRKSAYQYTPGGVRSITPGSILKNNNSLHIPILLRGQEIGSIEMQRKDKADWSQSERDLAQKVVLQAALALDNSRLLEETRQHAVQEQTVNEISGRLNRSLDVDTLLQTAVRELASLPEVTEASVFINSSTEDKNQKVDLNHWLPK